jgi:hypothetical protein
MPQNPDPKVALARHMAAHLLADRVVIVYTQRDGTFGYASYGVDSKRCAEARKLGDRLYEETERFFGEGDEDGT